MSFSKDLKEELSKLNNLANKELVKDELYGYLISCNTTVDGKNFVRYATENEYNINRFSKLLKNMNIDFKIEMEGKSFVVKFKKDMLSNYDASKDFSNEETKKAIARGAFMGAGSINEPDSKYHLEIGFSDEQNAIFVMELIEDFGICFKLIKNKNKFTIYIKEGEEISNFLALIGANNAVLKFEDTRVKREMRGKVNRLVNCKSANLNKILNASIEQVEAIKKLQAKKQFNKLDDNLKEIAILRLENPDLPLSELGKMLAVPVGKSGVNYRLKKIVEISKEL